MESHDKLSDFNHIFPESTYSVLYVTPLPAAALSASISWSTIVIIPQLQWFSNFRIRSWVAAGPAQERSALATGCLDEQQ
ncbi:hypothetical protein MY11210_008900 [Beauveria gryllotalpidicola]